MRIWEKYLSPDELRIYGEVGYGERLGFRDRPAILVIDVTYGFVGDRPEEIADSIRRFPLSCGVVGWRAMERIAKVLEVARARNLPVFYTIPDTDRLNLGVGTVKRVRRHSQPIGPRGGEIADPVAPQAGEVVIYKRKASAFFATALVHDLTFLGVNQLLCCGVSTSGCVRATVVDAFSYGFQVALIEDCTFDRSEIAHAINLFDMHQKYADVVESSEALAYLQNLPVGMFPGWSRSPR